jgi:transcription antitermination factor NusG
MDEHHNPQIISEPPAVWYALRTYNSKEGDISNFLKENDIQHFIPMIYSEKKSGENKPHRVLVPVVHNLLFIRKTTSEKQLAELLKKCIYPLSVMKKINSNEWYEISDKEMTEFRLICDPDHKGTQYVSQEEAETKIGKKIRIIRGQFRGIEGKLARYGAEYYVVKTLAGIGVLLHIPRWYCEEIQ